MSARARPPKIAWVGAAPLLRPHLRRRRRVRPPRLRDRGPVHALRRRLHRRLQAPGRLPGADDRRRREGRPRRGRRTVDDRDREEFDETREASRSVRRSRRPLPEAEVVAVGAAGEGVEITVQRGLVQEDVPRTQQPRRRDPGRGVRGVRARRSWPDRLRPDWLQDRPRRTRRPRTPTGGAHGPSTAAWCSRSRSSTRTTSSRRASRRRIADDMPFWTWRGDAARRAPATPTSTGRSSSARRGPTGHAQDVPRLDEVADRVGGAVVEQDPDELRRRLPSSSAARDSRLRRLVETPRRARRDRVADRGRRPQRAVPVGGRHRSEVGAEAQERRDDRARALAARHHPLHRVPLLEPRDGLRGRDLPVPRRGDHARHRGHRQLRRASSTPRSTCRWSRRS